MVRHFILICVTLLSFLLPSALYADCTDNVWREYHKRIRSQEVKICLGYVVIINADTGFSFNDLHSWLLVKNNDKWEICEPSRIPVVFNNQRLEYLPLIIGQRAYKAVETEQKLIALGYDAQLFLKVTKSLGVIVRKQLLIQVKEKSSIHWIEINN